MVQIQKIIVLGEQLCLDFINAVGWHPNESMCVEHLTSYSVFIQWCQKTEIINTEQASFFLEESRKRSVEADKVIKRVIELRKSVFRILLAVIAKDTPNEQDIDLLNSEIARVLPFSKLQYTDNQFIWKRAKETKNLDWMLSIIVNDIIELLTSNKLERLKVCDDDHCGWIFLDMSKNKSRRWCSMQDCGNRAKARRHYYNKKISKNEETE